MQKKRSNSQTKKPKIQRQPPEIHNEIVLYHKTSLKLEQLHQQLSQLYQARQSYFMAGEDVRSTLLRQAYLVSEQEELQQIILVYCNQFQQQHRLATTIKLLETQFAQLSQQMDQIQQKNQSYSQWKNKQMNSHQILINQHKINSVRIQLFEAECRVDSRQNGKKLRSLICQFISMICRRKGIKYDEKQPVQIWLALNNLISEVAQHLRTHEVEEYLSYLNTLNILVHRYVQPQPEKYDDSHLKKKISDVVQKINIAKSELTTLHLQEKQAKIRYEIRENKLNDQQVRKKVRQIHQEQEKRMDFVQKTQQRIDRIRQMVGGAPDDNRQWTHQQKLLKTQKEVKMYEKSLKQVREYLMSVLIKSKPAAQGNFNRWLDELVEGHLQKRQWSLSHLQSQVQSRQSSRDSTPTCQTVRFQPMHQYSNTFSADKENSQPLAGSKHAKLKNIIGSQKQQRDRETIARECLKSGRKLSGYGLLLPVGSCLQYNQSLQSTVRRSQPKKKSAAK